jgi:hypothetical protein
VFGEAAASVTQPWATTTPARSAPGIIGGGVLSPSMAPQHHGVEAVERHGPHRDDNLAGIGDGLGQSSGSACGSTTPAASAARAASAGPVAISSASTRGAAPAQAVAIDEEYAAQHPAVA